MNLLLNPQTKKQLELFIKNPSHAVAVIGEPGSGKSYLARYSAASLLGMPQELMLSYAYNLSVDGATAGIEEVRELQRFLSLKVPGYKSIKRTVIIENTELLSQPATNALLKTLEEPPQDTVIFCCVKQRDKLPATILSRVQQINVFAVNLDAATAYYNNRYGSGNIKKAYALSSGNVGLMSAVLTDDQEHPLVKGILKAKELLSMQRYQRLVQIDKLTKESSPGLDKILDAIFRVLEANYRYMRLSPDNRKNMSLAHSRVMAVEQALFDLENNVQSKLLLTRLFLAL